MEITSYFYQNTANRYSGSNLVTIRMWWAMIFYNSMKLYIPFTFRLKLFIGRRGKTRNPANLSVSPWKKNDGTLFEIKMFQSVIVIWYKNYDFFFLAGMRVNKHYTNTPAIESQKGVRSFFI